MTVSLESPIFIISAELANDENVEINAIRSKRDLCFFIQKVKLNRSKKQFYDFEYLIFILCQNSGCAQRKKGYDL